MTNSPSLDVGEKYAAQGATAPRITLDYMKSQIDKVFYTSADAPLHRRDSTPALAAMTICTLVMKSGFIVIGKSAPLSPENFNREKGQTFAYEDAIRQLWPMFAFHQLQATYEQRQRDD
jgi:Phage protein (N4 Gp49/phage Sf6 gene 66) family